MKSIFFYMILILISISLNFCKKNTTPLNSDIFKESQTEMDSIISLKIGNRYIYHWSIVDIKLHVGDEGEYINMIESDTSINNKTYFVFNYGNFLFNDGKYLRTEDKKVIQWDDNKEKIFFDFSVDVGDTVKYGSRVLKVDSVCYSKIFYNEPEELTVFSTTQIDTNYFVYYSYCTKFGFRQFMEIKGNIIESISLFGCMINNKTYGYGF